MKHALRFRLFPEEKETMKYTIGEVSKLKNIPISTLHYYDKEGGASLEERLRMFGERKETVHRQISDLEEQLKLLDRKMTGLQDGVLFFRPGK